MAIKKNNKKLHNPKAYVPSVYIPCWLIQVSSSLLSHQAKLLYGRLSQWSNENGKVFRSVPQLAEELGCSKSTIDRTIKELKEAGLIGTFQPKKGGVNHFEFYDHDWMYAPIKDQLSYKSNISNVTSDVTLPHVKSDVPPTSDVTSININKIKRNNINKYIGTSAEAPDFDYNGFDEQDEKSDYQDNQLICRENNIQVIEIKRDVVKSDYCDNQTYFLVTSFWQPIASIVIIWPFIWSASSSSGIAVISFDLFATFSWAKTKPKST